MMNAESSKVSDTFDTEADNVAGPLAATTVNFPRSNAVWPPPAESVKPPAEPPGEATKPTWFTRASNSVNTWPVESVSRTR